ncbi:MAG TPA: DUF2946 family protein [Azonexus sp.]|nr:DUF2946 family protein [Azonexus sp.]
MTVDLSAIAKWPNVPACYDWLSLDRRGDWRLQGERVMHSGLINFINRQYGCDESGCWFLQNGPQRVFVSLAYTPWVFRREAEGFVSHAGQPAGAVEAIYLDTEGNILLATKLGIGLLDDRELTQFLGECRDADGQMPDERAFLELMNGNSVPIYWQKIALQPIAVVDVPKRFKFNPLPQP